jgi:hypothetical protein
MSDKPNTEPNHIANICAIAQGLLASGHFTEISREAIDGEEFESPSAKSWDVGADWKEEGAPRRCFSYVAGEAISIYREILSDWERHEVSDSEKTDAAPS